MRVARMVNSAPGGTRKSKPCNVNEVSDEAKVICIPCQSCAVGEGLKAERHNHKDSRLERHDRTRNDKGKTRKDQTRHGNTQDREEIEKRQRRDREDKTKQDKTREGKTRPNQTRLALFCLTLVLSCLSCLFSVSALFLVLSLPR